MRIPWAKSKAEQLDLLITEASVPPDSKALDLSRLAELEPERNVSDGPPAGPNGPDIGRPLHVAIASLREDAGNPRTEYPDLELDELAEDIREHGILQPIVVHPADGEGHYLVHFGTKRLRAARRAGLNEVPIVVRDVAADPYAQVAENQKRHGLSILDLARFIRSRVDLGESNASIARRLGMNLTTVAHHLTLLDLPPELDEALKSGRCTSPRTLHELSKLHRDEAARVRALVTGDAEITRTAVAEIKAEAASGSSTSSESLVAQANAACARLERTLARLKNLQQGGRGIDLIALRQRVTDLASRLA